MHPQLFPKLHKIRVMYVDDTESADDKEIADYKKQNEQAFWQAATQLHPNHIGSSLTPCENCLFTLDFFPHFPFALYALLKGERYHVYLVDIHAEQGTPLNRWDANQYQELAGQFKDRLNLLFPELNTGTVINGENHILPLIGRLPHRFNPYVVWMSIHYNPKDALEAGVNVSQIATKGQDLIGVLGSAINWLKPQFLDKLSVPLPGKALPLLNTRDYGMQHPVYIDFIQQQLRIDTGVEITYASGASLTSGLPTQLGKTYIRNIAGGSTKGLPLRFLIRGGKILKEDKERLKPYPSRFFEDSEGDERKQRDAQERKYPDLKKIRTEFDEKVQSDNRGTVWDSSRGLETISSVEFAWWYLYHSVVHLYVHSLSNEEDLSEFDGTALAKDAECFDSLNALLISKHFSEKASQFGSDDFGKDYGDLELLWVPQIVSLAADLADSDADVSSRLSELRKEPVNILERMLADTKKEERLLRIAYFRQWYLSDDFYLLLRTLYALENSLKDKIELKLVLFRFYKDGKSLHEQF